MVSQVLRQLGKGMNVAAIVREWRGSISKEAISEAVELANRAFADHAPQYALEPSSK